MILPGGQCDQDTCLIIKALIYITWIAQPVIILRPNTIIPVFGRALSRLLNDNQNNSLLM